MTSITIKGMVMPEGKLLLDLPPDLPPGPVEGEMRLRNATLGERTDLIGLWSVHTDVHDTDAFADDFRRRASR
ncbi:MAG: hypothetical protein OHK0046_50580 [Anaerolineae bacterium]